ENDGKKLEDSFSAACSSLSGDGKGHSPPSASVRTHSLNLLPLRLYMVQDPTPTPPTTTAAAPLLEPGTALCLSGGGYRAMLFHLGSLWRLNEAGLLRKLNRISSVSGGSITAGMLGLQ